jgi:hypothetical protein
MIRRASTLTAVAVGKARKHLAAPRHSPRAAPRRQLDVVLNQWSDNKKDYQERPDALQAIANPIVRAEGIRPACRRPRTPVSPRHTVLVFALRRRP